VDPQSLEELFHLYLEKNKVEYTEKEGIYTVKFKKKDAELFGEEIKATFNSSKKTDAQLLGIGNLIFDNIVSRSMISPIYGNFKLVTENVLMEANEKLPELEEKGEYRIEEGKTKALFVLWEINIRSAAENIHLVRPLIKIDDKVFHAEGIETCEFEAMDEEFNVRLEDFAKHLEKHLKKEIDASRKAHDQKIKELVEIAMAHAESQYLELQNGEQKLRDKIEETRDKMVSASNFDAKDKYNQQIKKLTTRVNKLVEDNKVDREAIKKLHDDEADTIRAREMDMDVRAVCTAQIEMPLLTIKYSENKYLYISCLKKFFKV